MKLDVESSDKTCGTCGQLIVVAAAVVLVGVPFFSQYDWKMLLLGDAIGEFDVEEVVEKLLAKVDTVVVVEHESVELSRTSLGLPAACVPIILFI